MDIGTEFVYDVRETVSDRNCIKITEERYVLKNNGFIFDRYKDGILQDEVSGKGTYANGHIRNDHMREIGTEDVDTAYGVKNLAHYSTNLCGGGTELFTDGKIAYRYIERQMWSGGVIYEKTSTLVRTSLLPRD